MSQVKRAVVLAAGLGSRLRPLTNDVPKCLTEVCGKSILESTLDNLEKNHIEETAITVGYLGDVVISLPRAEAQAAEVGHDRHAELQLLVVHGVLHLLGYDDTGVEQRAQMWAAQAEILQDLGVEVHLPKA